MSVDGLEREVAAIRWWHQIDLGNGIVTPGLDRSAYRLGMLGLPADLGGLTVLDVGAWDGFFSFEAERRGAARVLATDSFCWDGDGWGTKRGFELARRVLASKVQDLSIDVLDLSPQRVGVFDLVLCLGVLYHMQHPMLALQRIFSVTGRQLLLETQVGLLWHRQAAAEFYPGDDLDGDPTNWWGPNPAAVVGMLQSVGFREVRIVTQYPSLVARAHKAVWMRLQRRQPFLQTLQRARLVVHAWR